MDVNERFDLISEVGQEIITHDQLKELLAKKKTLIAYDGFEPSGKIHIAQGLLRAINLNKMIKAGCKFKMLIADWHAWANDKLGGDLEKISIAGKYFIEVWKSCGLDTKHIDFIWASDLVKENGYWAKVMQIARNNTVKRIIRCSQIMGRAESDSLSAAQILYPCMQAADIFHLKADIAQLGMDQRKVNVLAREIGPKIGFWKPIIVSHHMLMGLTEPPKDVDINERVTALKMSKSKPDSAIFMTDSTDDVNRKIRKAYCPENVADENPILEYCRYIIFEKIVKFDVKRQEKFGGDVSFSTYEELETAFVKGELHPMDLKNSVSFYLNEMLDPVRKHFTENKKAKKLLETVSSF